MSHYRFTIAGYPATACQSIFRSSVEAMGGSLEIRAVFPDGDVKIDLLNKVSALPVQSGAAEKGKGGSPAVRELSVMPFAWN